MLEAEPPHERVADSLTGPDSGVTGEPGELLPVVAVGASAGGLDAFTELLRRLPADTGMAFVFIQHLSPNHESMLSHLLARETAMPVNQAEDGAVLSPNQVFVIPPNTAMTVSGLTLKLKPREAAGTAVDAFLRSLAASQRTRSVAVILSGTGSDGALGVQAIAEEGGVVFAQEPASAKFDGMPRAAIATGCVDFVQHPQAIAAELARIAREPRLIHRDNLELDQQFKHSERDYGAVLDLLREGSGIDFSLYRQTTVKRRVLRRLGLLKFDSLRDYAQHVRENPDEAQSLAQDILIRVTRFFRDPEVFEVLSRRVFPALIRKTAPDRFVRIWAPGCSTGEEAYSLAICFLETAEQMQRRVPVQVFATDINDAAIQKARRGVYIENIAGDVSPERLARYFVRAGTDFQVSRKLRDLCIFSRHDLLTDPPLSRMCLVSCRNVLIYLDSMQQQAFSKFHFALDPGGFLLLGKSETATSSPELFAPLDKQAKLYVRQESARPAAAAYFSRKKEPVPAAPGMLGKAFPQRTIDVRAQADRVVLERYGPARVVVNADLTAENGGETDSSHALLPGMSNQPFLEVVKKSEGDALRNAVRAAAQSGHSVRMEQIKVGEGPSSIEVNIEVTPLGPERKHFLIAFEEGAEPYLETGEAPSREGNRRFQARIHRLEKELASSRAHLEAVIVDQEAANEEVISANEELQSLNEELESSKEELEATNEELTTINQELQVRNMELENAREFAQTTIDTVRGALVVLGPDLRVLKVNQSFCRTFRLSPQEVEHRFIYDLGNGQFNSPRLRELLEVILPESRNMEDFELVHEWPQGRRILLLNARRFEHEQRVLLAIEDVTHQRRAEEELRQSQKMEAIGYLAAGVAHDFNNLLTGVIGNASMLLDSMRDDDPGAAILQNVITGGERAAELTRQLLAYAGKGRFYLERVNLSEVVIQTGKLIHASVPHNVQLQMNLDKDPPLLLADPSQMQQIVMNLMINAVEAIGESGGVVRVMTGRQTITGEPLPDLLPNQQADAGDYIFVEVTDNGSGMDQQTMLRIFDPFFTTKFAGRGLGLAAVLGIVRQQKGAVQLHSVPGRGTCFKVLFCVSDSTLSHVARDVSGDELHGAGTLLVIDDEELIRSFSRSALEPYGYRVLLAGDGPEAVRIFRERPDDIGLVLLDVAMPEMDGPETLEKLQEIRPDVRVLVCSGFGDQELKESFEGKPIAGFLAKPYTVKQLARKVKDCMPPAEC